MSEVKPSVVKAWMIESSSTPGLEYAVVEWTNGRMTCECPSFIRGKQQRGLGMFERSCKHTIAAAEMKAELVGNLAGTSKRPNVQWDIPQPAKVQAPKDPFALMAEAEKEKLR